MSALRLQYTRHFWIEYRRMRRNREWHPVSMALVRGTVLQGIERVDGQRGGETYYARTLHVGGRWTLEVSIVRKRGYILVVSVYWKGYQ